MPVKTTGVEWKKFYTDKKVWGDGSSHEDEQITIDGEEWDGAGISLTEVSDDSLIVLTGGFYFKDLDSYSRGGESFEKVFRAWKKTQGNTIVVCSCPNDKVEAVKKAILDAGGKIS
jgi:hypothetical protein